MSVKSISSVNSLTSLKESEAIKEGARKYSLVEIDGANFIGKGLLRHALKYAYFVSVEGATIKVFAKGVRKTLGFSNKEYSFWQVRHECAKALGNHTVFSTVDSEREVIELKVTRPWQPPCGATFGIVFSGKQQEEGLLISVLESIDNIAGLTKPNCDVVIIGSGDYDIEKIRARFNGLSITYESLECVDSAGRFLACVKKYRIFELASRDLLIVCHTRIKFPADFFIKASNTFLECASPKVIFNVQGIPQPYLDYVLVGSYDLAKLNPKRTLTSEDFGDNYLNHLDRRVPYVDGGVVMFDKRAIRNNPYNKKIAWGEAEDVEMCGRLYQEGVLIDYAAQVVCESVTNKLSYAKNDFVKGIYKVKRKLSLAVDF